ncbi:MAG: DUF928 domain-containing protein [Leptolyngbya sp. SIO3F4]|nr:DUF928 domain-containing protein [Leptolyngbya sp. SIO3F4]
MKFFKIFSTIMLLALGLPLMTTNAEAFPGYKPKPRGIPNIRVSGGTRSPSSLSCINDLEVSQLTSIFPDDDFGYTTDQYPAFQWYMPSNNASHVEFNLYEVINEDEGVFQPIYQTAFAPSSVAGIATLQLPQQAGVVPLSTNNYYYWSVEIYCPDDPSAIMTAEGFVELLTPEPSLAEALANSNGMNRAAIAAENSLWFDTTRALTEHLQNEPNDLQAIASWKTLMESIGLENISEAPLLP